MKLSKKMLAIGTLATLPILPIAFSSCTNLSSENDLLRAKVSELNSTIENTKTKLDSLENENKQLDYKNKAQDVDAKVDMFKLRGEYAAYIGFINDNVTKKYDLIFDKAASTSPSLKSFWDNLKNVLLSWRLVSKANNKEEITIYTQAWTIKKNQNGKYGLAKYTNDVISAKTLDQIKEDKDLLNILLKSESIVKKKEDNAEKSETNKMVQDGSETKENKKVETILDKYDIKNVSATKINLNDIFSKKYFEGSFISQNTKESLFRALYVANDDLGMLLSKSIKNFQPKQK
ncbi:hypothetical protein [Mycoplasma bradburyae]|uniref:Lipoprotein n=1 Tax=Mycoplasma bradburyae TaxID=2963128 RepID=A0AAW6HPL0_9MOLU|nr:hypothetical protein [Mycoplasma bradburyae]MDC4181857.1 hypothetical protein [Mycoplasma bradburyae]MDC4183234.1 hypothetical protein [Mycoplasma bradburyae]UTS70156.1 hypothetical protein NMG68_00135 [Mycoplasma bradburyae]UTS70880.1 hypothetical protein NMG77_00120 [Mycoplasma bradburyae]